MVSTEPVFSIVVCVPIRLSFKSNSPLLLILKLLSFASFNDKPFSEIVKPPCPLVVSIFNDSPESVSVNGELLSILSVNAWLLTSNALLFIVNVN